MAEIEPLCEVATWDILEEVEAGAESPFDVILVELQHIEQSNGPKLLVGKLGTIP